MDLQLAYLATPQTAAQVSAAQQAPQAAQIAAQTAFADQVHKREETVAETAHAEGTHIRTNADAQGGGQGQTPHQRRNPQQTPDDGSPLGLSGDGEHFIDVTA